MPELIEQMYCSQQIVIPPKYPYIIKRFAKAAIKTQPYDLLRWSCEYFQALASGRAPPVKLRLEYPVYSSRGGLTAGYLRMLYQQLKGDEELRKAALERSWRGVCLDPLELVRILCLCDAYSDGIQTVKTLVFFAVAGGLLTKSLTQTMILLCETMTAEAEGGSAAVPVEHFLLMYEHLARLDASTDVNYINGIREGQQIEAQPEQEEQPIPDEISTKSVADADAPSEEFYLDKGQRRRSLPVVGEKYVCATRISDHLSARISVANQRSPSVERDAAITRHELSLPTEYETSEDNMDHKLREMSKEMLTERSNAGLEDTHEAQEKKPTRREAVKIVVTDEDGMELPPVIDGEETESVLDCNFGEDQGTEVEEDATNNEDVYDKDRILLLIEEHRQNRLQRIEDVEVTLDELAAIVQRWKYINYDLGMVAGRQMSTGSGEFIVQSIERDILAVIDEQIAILPDPDLQKKKARPEEVQMIRGLLEEHVEDNIELIVPEQEEEEEEEVESPEVVVVYAVPGIGPPVPERMVAAVVAHARRVADSTEGLFMPRHMRDFLCPPLELYADPLEKAAEELSDQI